MAGIEPATPCLQSGKPNLPNLAGADATRLKTAHCDKPRQTVFSFFFRLLFVIYSALPQLVLRSYYVPLRPAGIWQCGFQCTVIPPQQRLYFFPDPQGHKSFRPILIPACPMQRSQPAFAFGDVVHATNATDIRSITERHSLFLFSVVRIAVGASCDAPSPFGEQIWIYLVPLE